MIPPYSTDNVRETAARWVTRIHTCELSVAERDEFGRWLVASERHEMEFQHAMTIIAMVQDLPAETRAALLADVREVERPRHRVVWYAAAAAVLLCVLGALSVWTLQNYKGTRYETQVGEIRTVTFEDGTAAYLNTRTQIRWVNGESEREVFFKDGEALFDVAHDATKPFHVRLDKSDIRVLGTRFSIYRKQSGEISVTVLDGTVEVSGRALTLAEPTFVRVLHANDQLIYRGNRIIKDVVTADAKDVNRTVTRSLGRRLRFRDEPLSLLLDELRRNTTKPIVLADPRINDIRFGGILNVRDVSGTLRQLGSFSIRVTEEPERIVLSHDDVAQGN